MSKFSGPQGKGAMTTRRTQKRKEAEVRQLAALLAAHPNGVCDCTKIKGRGKAKHRPGSPDLHRIERDYA